ncbi:MAG: 4-phosphopantoate--beta-alanine ligase, partial [Archaeoglobaceae archaeon]
MIPKDHPRYESLMIREKLVEGVKMGVTAIQGLIAHGRGEAFDYILGERTREFALKAEKAAVAMMLLARHPVISVNGNTAVLVPKEIKKLAEVLNAKVEINVFHYSKERVARIAEFLSSFGINALCAGDAELKGLSSARRIVDSRGILIADVVLVPLEDGDRCEVLKRHGKKVVAIDLNPLSRTARMADITIVDNV